LDQQHENNYTFTNIRRDKGIFYALGPKLRKNIISNLSIYDVSPTVMNLMGLPMDHHTKGKSIADSMKR
jgi:predicted AlkP superfamily phosphohydrolase/phosphomutase